MTYIEKLQKVKSGFPEMTNEEAHEQVMMLDWITRQNEFLKSIYPQFLKDIDPNASFIGMCVALWNDETTRIKHENLFYVY